MRHTETTFQGEDRLTLYAQKWLPDEEPKAVLAIVHGIGEHSGRYQNVVNAMIPRGIAVCGFDLRGHGKSEGKRGHIDRWTQFRADVGHFLTWVQTWSAEVPIFVLGHSLGSAIAADYLMFEDTQILRGVILSGLPIEPAGVTKPFLVFVARLLSRILPRFSLNLGLDVNGLSRDKEVIQAYCDDPLVHPLASTRFGTECLDTFEAIRDRPELLKTSLLIVHGEDDPLNKVSGTKGYFERIASEDKELKVYTGMMHEPHNELGYKTVVNDMVNWIEARV